MKKFVPGIGESDFRSFREAGYSYVDKSSLISELLADSCLVHLFLRPHRFGKTLNMSMLGHFLRKTTEDMSHLFEGLSVWQDEQARKHFQRYPVISVTFKDVKATTFAGVAGEIREQLIHCFDAQRFLLDENRMASTMVQDFQRISPRTLTDDQLPFALQNLSRVLHRHYGERVVILVDEYDIPVQLGYLHGFFDNMALFLGRLLSACLKDNSSLSKGIMMGTQRIASDNLCYGLNHIMVHSIIDRRYGTCFGFTEDEVAAIIEPEQLEEVRTWYNGYLFGGHVIYNPWSILHYIDEGLLKPYWVNTASSDLIEYLAAKRGLGLTEKSEVLLRGEAIDVPIDSNIVLRDIDRNEDALWNFLLFAGYLKPVQLDLIEGRYYGKLAIPNREVKIVYEDMFQNWLYQAVPERAYVDDLVRAMFSGDAETMQEILEEIFLRVLSYQDGGGRKPEKLYHGFILGLCVHLESEYDVRSNRESGRGRADMLIRPKVPGKPGVVMEFKVLKAKETAEQALLSAARQVRDRKYATDLVAAGASPVYEYAMVFDGKQAYVKRVEELLVNP